MTIANRSNITYHVEHHLYQRVPFHRLPQLHALLLPRPYLHTRSLLRFMRPPA